MVKVITTVAAWPEAIVAMKNRLDLHLKEPFEFVVLIDTPTTPGPYNLWDPKLREKAIKIAEDTADRIHQVPEILHKNRSIQFPGTREKTKNNANTRAADTLQYAWNQEIFKSDQPVLILDNDMFPIADFRVSETLVNAPAAGIFSQSPSRDLSRTIPWIWSGLLFLDVPNMKNKQLWSFNCGKIDGIPVDVSGQTYHWLQSMKLLGVEPKWLPHFSSLNWTLPDSKTLTDRALISFLRNDDRNQGEKLYCELYDETFLHFRAGSNWNKESSEIVIRRNTEFLHALNRVNS
jgi:hypothetical protein